LGTEIRLDVADMWVTYSKNHRGIDHGSIFQEDDRKPVKSDQLDYQWHENEGADPTPSEMAFTRPLKDVVPRLELLGFNLDRVRREYDAVAAGWLEERQSRQDDDDEPVPDLISFAEFLEFATAHRPILAHCFTGPHGQCRQRPALHQQLLPPLSVTLPLHCLMNGDYSAFVTVGSRGHSGNPEPGCADAPNIQMGPSTEETDVSVSMVTFRKGGKREAVMAATKKLKVVMVKHGATDVTLGQVTAGPDSGQWVIRIHCADWVAFGKMAQGAMNDPKGRDAVAGLDAITEMVSRRVIAGVDL
jgi:hypothetical protein